MKKVIFTSLLLTAPFCKAADTPKEKTPIPYYCPNIVTLTHHHQEITTIPDCIGYPDLKRLSLKGNQITSFPNNLNCLLPMLVELSLNDNRMSTIPCNLPNLKILSLKNNLISTIPNDLSLSSLEDLDLENNLVQAVDPQILDQLPNLSFLGLAKNHLNPESTKKLREYATNRKGLFIWCISQKVVPNIKGALRYSTDL